MLLAVDIGNTNIKFGIFDEDTLIRTLTISCDKNKTADEYSVELYSLIRVMGIHRTDFGGCIISSVVPTVTARIRSAVRDLLDIDALIVGPGIKTGLNIHIEDPSQLGADLVVACVAANASYTAPCIVISMGTATVMCVIDRNKTMLGGPIAPGVMVSLNALTGNAALLYSVSLDAPKSVIGNNTDRSIRSGVVWGTVCMIDGMIDKIEQELGEKCTVVATGGMAKTIIKHCTHDITVQDDLIMQGLKLIYDKNTR